MLSLNCNTSHLACHLNLENTEYPADSYTYYVGVVCNGTQVGVGITKLEWKSGCIYMVKEYNILWIRMLLLIKVGQCRL